MFLTRGGPPALQAVVAGEVALDFPGQAPRGDRGRDFAETLLPDRESLATFRRASPAPPDADDFELVTPAGTARA